MSLEAGDAAELGELLQFLSDWLARDHDHLEASLTGFVGTSGYGTRELRNDLNRFAFQLGGSDGEPLFEPGQQ
ncbi:MAG TPA: hypothetical protein VK586_19715 [Streptosporangiaceae bacterium]|nr:hypothetical protein [Streptosporangiaceae bacterium]